MQTVIISIYIDSQDLIVAPEILSVAKLLCRDGGLNILGFGWETTRKRRTGRPCPVFLASASHLLNHRRPSLRF